MAAVPMQERPRVNRVTDGTLGGARVRDRWAGWGRGGGTREQVSAARGATWRVDLAAPRTVWKEVTSPKKGERRREPGPFRPRRHRRVDAAALPAAPPLRWL